MGNPQKGTYAWANQEPAKETTSPFMPPESETASANISVTNNVSDNVLDEASVVRNMQGIVLPMVNIIDHKLNLGASLNTNTPQTYNAGTSARIFGGDSPTRSTSFNGKSEWGRNRMLFNTKADLDDSFVNLGEAAGSNGRLSGRELRKWNRYNDVGLNFAQRVAVRRNFNRGYNNLSNYDKATLNTMESGWKKAERVDKSGNPYLEGTPEFENLTEGNYYNSRRDYNNALRAQRGNLDNYRYFTGADGKRTMQFRNLNGDWANLKGNESWVNLEYAVNAKRKAFDPLVAGYDDSRTKYSTDTFNDLSSTNLKSLMKWAGYTGEDPLKNADNMRNFNNFLSAKINGISNPVERAYLMKQLKTKLGSLNLYFSLASGDPNGYLLQPYYDNGASYGSGYLYGEAFKFGGRITYFDQGGSIIRYQDGGKPMWRSFVPGLATWDAWHDPSLQTWQKIATTGLDVLSLVPGVGMVGKGLGVAAKGAKALSAAGKLGKLSKIKNAKWAQNAITDVKAAREAKLAAGGASKVSQWAKDKGKLLTGTGSAPRVLQGAGLVAKGQVLSGSKNLLWGGLSYAGNASFKHAVSTPYNQFTGTTDEEEMPGGDYTVDTYTGDYYDYGASLGGNSGTLDGYYDFKTGEWTPYTDLNRRYVIPTECIGGKLIYFK